MLYRLLLMIAAALCAAPAAAQWRMAESNNFIVYSDSNERELREAVERLEIYHQLLRGYAGVTGPNSPVKLKVYMLRNMAGIAQVTGTSWIAGYYTYSPRGPIAVSIRRGRGGVSTGRTHIESAQEHGEEVLFHEYAHHFMYQYFPANYPWWYSEAFASFWGPIRFLPNNVVEIGHAPRGRMDVVMSGWIPTAQLLTARRPSDIGGQIHVLYAQGWLLFHYLRSTTEGASQLQRYLQAIVDGRTYEEAMESVWGPGARELDSQLRRYAGRGQAMRLSLRDLDLGPISIRPLSEAEQALLYDDIVLSSGLRRSDAPRFARTMREKVARFQSDPYALRMLAEAERLAGNRDEANRVVARLLSIAPDDPKGLMLRGLLQIDALRASGADDEEAWRAAREPLAQANRLAPTDAEILLAYYQSFQRQGVLPPAHAQNALMGALNLIPQDRTLRYLVAADFEARDMLEEAIFIIRPAAFAAHEPDDESEEARRRREREWERHGRAGTERRESAREMLQRLEARLAERNASQRQAPAATTD